MIEALGKDLRRYFWCESQARAPFLLRDAPAQRMLPVLLAYQADCLFSQGFPDMLREPEAANSAYPSC